MTAADELVLVRHGESTGNVARMRAYQAGAETIDVAERDADVVLTALGQRQATALAPVLHVGPDDTVWSSVFTRARQTARLALPPEAHTRLRLDERLRDRDFGILDRLTGLGIAARYPEEAQRRRHLGKFFHRPPGGEAWVDVALRLRTWLSELGPGRHVVFTHDVVIVVARYVLERLDEQQVLAVNDSQPLRNSSVTTLRRGPDAWTLVGHGVCDHLDGL